MSIRDVLHLGRGTRSLLGAWDRVLVDPPALCCEDAALCAACAADAHLTRPLAMAA